ncbi:MAG: DUF378 domain-containing protein [Clostridia bacterium]|nr:DUF378 domain-containing protein [Clostridia bacterium]
MIDRIALILTVVGALNWGTIGIFRYDLVSLICGEGGVPAPDNLLARIIYTVVALAGVWCISLLVRESGDSYPMAESH